MNKNENDKELKSEIVSVYLTPKIYEKVRKAAYINGREISQFLCFAGSQFADKILKEVEENAE